MSFRALQRVLRGVKNGSYLLAVLSAVSIISIMSSQPAQAESFLSKTVKCLVGPLLMAECKKPNVAPVEPAPPAPQTPANTSPQEPSAQPPAGEVVQPTQPAVPTNPRVVPYGTLDSSAHTPIAIEYTYDDGAAYSPQRVALMTPSSNAAHFNAYTGGFGAYSEVKGTSVSFVEPSNNGWKIAGIAWYWWLALVGLIAGLLGLKRYRRIRKSSVLSKAV
jgi:hypothetical protein